LRDEKVEEAPWALEDLRDGVVVRDLWMPVEVRLAGEEAFPPVRDSLRIFWKC
jgi:hypothetical protein